jgi:hypothetical protein
VRTTLTINDEVYRQTKAVAAATGRSVGSLVEEALRTALALRAHPSSSVEPLPTSPGSLLPGVDLDDSAGLLDLMERR